MENREKTGENVEQSGECPEGVPGDGSAATGHRTETMRRALRPMPSPERINFVMQRVYDRRKRFLYAHQVASALCDSEQLDLVCELLGVTSEQLLTALGAPSRSNYGYIVKVNGIDVRCDTTTDALALARAVASEQSATDVSKTEAPEPAAERTP